MGIIAFIVVGLVIGVVVGANMPEDAGGTVLTIVAGMTGALFGGIFAAAISGMNPLTQFFGLWAWVGAIAGAVIVLALYTLIVTAGEAPRSTAGSGDATTGRRSAL